MAETQSNYNISDIPEELRPYRSALLNAVFGQVFTPDYLKAHFPTATFIGTPQQQIPQAQQPQAQQPAPNPYADYGYTVTSGRGASDGSRLEEGIRQIEDEMRGRGYKKGGKMKRHRVSRKASGGRLATSAEELEKALDVTLGAGGTPLGGEYPEVSNYMPQLPSMVSSGTNGTIPVPRPISPPPPGPQPSTPGLTPGVPSVVGQPQNPGMPGMQPGFAPPSSTGGGEPRFVSQRPSNFAGAAQAAAAGYNPAQYADDTVAADLARKLGGTVNYTNTAGPIGPPSQASLNFGGGDSHSAGLIADAYTRGNPSQSELTQRLNAIRDDIRRAGGVPNFKSGGTMRFADGGFTGNETDLFGRNIAPQGGPTPNPITGQPGALNPYQPYTGGQRILNSGNFGQVGPDGIRQVSTPTLEGINSISSIPSNFFNGEIYAGRTADGAATTPFGIANDTFDAAGRLALGASQNSEYMSGLSPLRSSFGSTMDYIRRNPTGFTAGDINLGTLQAPQMEAPAAIDASTGNINPNDITSGFSPMFMQPVQSVTTDRFIDNGNAGTYMDPYMRAVTDVRRNDATRAFNEQKQLRDAQMVKAGAFGNNRRAVADSLATRDLNTALDRITAEGAEGGYLNAQQQYERDRAAGIGVGTTNQRAALEVGGRNLDASLQGNQLRGNIGLQALLANQGANLTAAQANQNAGLTAGRSNLEAAMNTQNLSRTTGLQAAQANQGTRLAQNQALLNAAAREDELAQQAAQGNYRNALDAMGQQTNSAVSASNIAQNRADLSRLAQSMEIQKARELMAIGAGIDARTQASLDTGYQDFINRRNFPYQQLNWAQGILSGTPMGYNQEGVMFGKTNTGAQAAGLAAAGIGALSNYYGARQN